MLRINNFSPYRYQFHPKAFRNKRLLKGNVIFVEWILIHLTETIPVRHGGKERTHGLHGALVQSMEEQVCRECLFTARLVAYAVL
jgi:hypothetical protein